MKFLKRFFLTILVVALAAVGVGYLLPDSAHVERSTRIEAPPEAVFPYVNNFHKFNEWSPWLEKDPGTNYSIEGPESGVGARMTWDSDDPEVGSGSNLIIHSRPPSRVTTRLEFGDRGTATAWFEIEPVDGASRITWGFDTEFGRDLIGRYFGLMMDRWVGNDYEQGLANLKALVEEQQG